MTVPTGPVYYPFAVVPPTSSSNVIPNDLIIETVYPGIILDGAEIGSVYFVMREVSGCTWFVVNADFNETTLQWTQEDPTNPNLPSYAMEICGSGTWNYYSAVPTLVPGTTVAWVLMNQITANGLSIIEPLPITNSSNAMQQILATWNAGSAVQLTARYVDVTDLSSASSSLLDNLAVNSVSKWAVDKTGTLTVGIIPSARISGLTPFPGFNNVTLTGTTTMTGPVNMTSTLDVTGAVTAHSSLTADSTFYATGLTTLHGAVVADSTVTVTGLTDLNGGLNVTGGETQTGGPVTIGGILTTNSNFVANGLAQLSNATVSGNLTEVGGGPVFPLTSPDASVTVATVGHGYTVEVTSPYLPTVRAQIRVPLSTTVPFSQSLSLPTLPGPGSRAYNLYAFAGWPCNTGGTMTLSGSGATWESTTVYSNFSGMDTIDLIGTAVGGQTPSVTWSVPNTNGSATSNIALSITAYPV